MDIAIIYSSNTGNTKLVAEAIKEQLENENIVYFGEVPDNIPSADIYFIGSWTNKGNASDDIIEFINKIKNKEIAYFGTAGYGENQDYYKKLFERIQNYIDSSNKILGYFYCQGKMPIQVRERYVKIITEHPEDKNLTVNIENFDKALSHPDEKDLKNVKRWVESLNI